MAAVRVRTIFSLTNLAMLGAAVGFWIFLPQYAAYAVYAFLGWTVVGFALLFTPWANRAPTSSPPGPTSAASGPGPDAGSRPLPSGAATPSIDFCVFCAADLPPEATRCPSCGHVARRF